MNLLRSFIFFLSILYTFSGVSAQVKVIKSGSEIKINDETLVLIGNYTDNSVGRTGWNWGWSYWFGPSYNADYSLYDRAEYIALYRKKQEKQDSTVILELKGAQSKGAEYSSKRFQFKSNKSELLQLHKYFKITFLPKNFENRDYALSLQLGDKINLNIRRASVFGRRCAVIGVSEEDSGGFFLITERGVDELFGIIK